VAEANKKVKGEELKPETGAAKSECNDLVMRFPIILNNHTVMVIHLFTRHDCFEDMWMHDCIHNESRRWQEQGAEQLIEQLQDHWTPAFLMKLGEVITKKLKEHDAECGTSFAYRRSEPTYKEMKIKIQPDNHNNWVWQPKVIKVGELIAELSKYDDSIPITIGHKEHAFIKKIELKDGWLRLTG
jgi:hypothetical protein